MEMIMQKLSTQYILCQGTCMKLQDIGIDDSNLSTIMNTGLHTADYHNLSGKNHFEIVKQTVPSEPAFYISRYLIPSISNLDSDIFIQKEENALPNSSQYILESEFLSQTSQESTVLLSGPPGCGKSVLLARIARFSQKQLTNHIIAYIQLHELVESLGTSQITSDNVTISVLRVISPSSIGRALLRLAIAKRKIKLDVYFDGFDSIEPTKIQFAIDVLKLSKNTFNKMFISTRPGYQSVLEKTLDVVSYLIHPFNRAEQLQLLQFHWKENISKSSPTRLQVVAHNSLQQFDVLMKSHNHDNQILGNPMLCKFLAQAYLPSERLFVDSDNFTTSSFQQCPNEFITEQLNIKVIFTMFKTFIDLIFKNDSQKCNCTDIGMNTNHKIKNYYLQRAIQATNPEIFNGLCFTKQSSFMEIVKWHLLVSPPEIDKQIEMVCSGNMEFLSSTLNDYLVSEFLASSLSSQMMNKVCAKFVGQVLQSFVISQVKDNNKLDCVALPMAHTFEPYSDFIWTFTRKETAFFLNEHLTSRKSNKLNQSLTNSILFSLEAKDLYMILSSCIQENYLNIFQLYKDLLKGAMDYKLRKYKAYFLQQIVYINFEHPVPRCFVIANMAAEYGNAEMVQMCFSFFLECFNHDLGSTIESVPIELKTPIHWAVEKRDVAMVRHLLKLKFSIEDRALLYYCVYGSIGKDDIFINKCLNICKLLLERNKSLIFEKCCSTNGRPLQSPVIVLGVHFKLLKYLISNGADFRVTHKRENIIERAAQYMIPQDFYELCTFLVRKRFALDLFRRNMLWNSPLHKILCSKHSHDRLKILFVYEISEININDINEEGHNAFLCAVLGRQSLILIKNLIKRGANYKALDYKKRNALHLAVTYTLYGSCNLKTVRYLLSLGISVRDRDLHGKLPLDTAVETLTWCETNVSLKFSKTKSDVLKSILGLLQMHTY